MKRVRDLVVVAILFFVLHKLVHRWKESTTDLRTEYYGKQWEHETSRCLMRLNSRRIIRRQEKALIKTGFLEGTPTYEEYAKQLASDKSVPKVVHSLWGLWDDVPPPDSIIEEWLLDGWDVIVHDRRDAEKLIATQFKWLEPIYNRLTKIQRSDLLRYLFVYIYGGLYVDADCFNAYHLSPTEILYRGSFDPKKHNFLSVLEHVSPLPTPEEVVEETVRKALALARGIEYVKKQRSAKYENDFEYIGPDNGDFKVRNGIGELPIRIANYAFYAKAGSPILYQIIWHVLARCQKIISMGPEQTDLITDTFYNILYSTGPDTFTESVFGGPGLSFLDNIALLTDTKVFRNANSGTTWKTANSGANDIEK